jgi:peptidoglycan/LPS O-acetylase OafA/YrhL
MSKSPALPYRRDIDGIRAIAVTSVVLYHAGIWPFSGGYIGVDIFYVISGYLITGIIVNDLHKDRFSILGFYDRRIRRIFPALFVMTIFTSIVSWFVLLPVEFKEYGESLTAMSFFASNVYFYFKSGYFDHQSTLRPLLHTWSLAVEEQYYVLFPPLMMILYRINRGIVPYVCTAVWAASLAATLHEIGIEQKAAFYLPQYRAWELLTGSLLTIRLFKATENAPLAQGLSILGLAGILGPIFLYTADTQFPGAAAISPVCG